MKKLLALLIFLALASTFGWSQVAVISGQVLSLNGGFVPFAKIRVCSVTSSGTPCNPTVPVYYDYGLNNIATNPTADQYGNYLYYGPALSSPNIYIVQVIPQAGTTWMYAVNGPSISAGGGTLTGPLTDLFGFIGPLTGNVTGNVTGNLTGSVTGHASLDLPLTGGTLSGSLTDASGFIGPLNGNANTTSAFASTPSQCPGMEFATGIQANGTPNCSTPTGLGTVTTTGSPSSGQTAEFTGSSSITGIPTTGTGNYVKSAGPTLTGTINLPGGGSWNSSGALNGTSANFSGNVSANDFIPAPPSNTQGMWQRMGVVIPGNAATSYAAQEATALPDGSGGVDLWWNCGWATTNLCYANAPDGIHFGAQQVLFGGYAHGYVVKIGSTYYYYGANFATGSLAFSRFHSTDKVTWTLDASNILPVNGSGWESTYVGNIDVWTASSTNGGPCPGNTWCALHEALGSTGVWAIGLATSADGLTWTESGSNPVISRTAAAAGGPEMHYSTADSTYMLWYHAAASTNQPTDIVTAFSTNLTTWNTTSASGGLQRLTVDEGAYTTAGQVADPTIIQITPGGPTGAQCPTGYTTCTYLYYDGFDTQSPSAGNTNNIKLVISPLTIAQIQISQTNGTSWQNWNDGVTGTGLGVLQNQPFLISPTLDFTTIKDGLFFFGSGATRIDGNSGAISLTAPSVTFGSPSSGDTYTLSDRVMAIQNFNANGGVYQMNAVTILPSWLAGYSGNSGGTKVQLAATWTPVAQKPLCDDGGGNTITCTTLGPAVSGASAAVASGTPITLFTPPTPGTMAEYKVIGTVAGNGTIATFGGMADLLVGSIDCGITQNFTGSTGVTFTLSGCAVQGTQASGSSNTIAWSYVRIQ